MSRLDDYPRAAQADAPPPEAATMSVAAAARELGWTEDQVRAALRSNRLRGFKPGERVWTVLRVSVEAAKGTSEPGFISSDLADDLKRFSRLTAELIGLSHTIEDKLRNASPCRDGGSR